MNLQGPNCLGKANFSPHVPGLLGKPLSSNFSLKVQTKEADAQDLIHSLLRLPVTREGSCLPTLNTLVVCRDGNWKLLSCRGRERPEVVFRYLSNCGESVGSVFAGPPSVTHGSPGLFMSVCKGAMCIISTEFN